MKLVPLLIAIFFPCCAYNSKGDKAERLSSSFQQARGCRGELIYDSSTTQACLKMLDKEIEALGLLAYKRGLFYESKKDSLRQDIERLRNFLEAMAKDRELLQKQAKAEHILCKKKLVKTETELQTTQDRLREMETEAAYLLESKHMEMERLQKERDDALAKVDTLCAESCFLKGYGNHLERKVCALVVKLHEYHQQLQRKAEEVVQTRGSAVDEWEWIRQSMTTFENNLLEFQSANAQGSWQEASPSEDFQSLDSLQNSCCSTEDESVSENSSEIVNQFLGNRDSQFMPSKVIGSRNGLSMSNNSERFFPHNVDQSYAQMMYACGSHYAPYKIGERDDYEEMQFQEGKSSMLQYSLDENTICGASFAENEKMSRYPT